MRKSVFFLLLLLVPAATVGITLGVMGYIFTEPADPAQSKSVLFEIRNQESFKSITRELEERGLIRYAWAFNIIAQLRGKDKSIMAGEYELSPDMTPEQILEKLVSGKMVLRRITFKEGASMWEIGALLEQAGITTKAAFESALVDRALLKEAEIEASSFEGYLFPETYQFSKDTSPKAIVMKMVGELRSRWKPELTLRAQELGMTQHEVLTLASIIEKESRVPDEMSLVASVFHNRLKSDMRLQADPTVIYGLTNFDGNLTRADLTNPHPYNTYVHTGLPPGPIASSGMNAIYAALFPADSNYLFFVADGTGRHQFSANLDNHNRMVNEFQRAQ